METENDLKSEWLIQEVNILLHEIMINKGITEEAELICRNLRKGITAPTRCTSTKRPCASRTSHNTTLARSVAFVNMAASYSGQDDIKSESVADIEADGEQLMMRRERLKTPKSSIWRKE